MSLESVTGDAIQDSVLYLSSRAALESIGSNPYWPKWDSPWWHMALLHEMGKADLIPKETARKMLSEVKRTHLPYFFREDAPADKGPDQDAPCPCALGNIYQILSATGLDVDDPLPWTRGWFLRYQMPDGGLSCDEDAYHATPAASSMVGTIAPLEAILLFTRRPFTPEEERFLDAGARCLIERKLMLGCSAPYNAEERLDEEDWLKPCFPRFYFYDVLRGLEFILRWAEIRNQPLPLSAISGVIRTFQERFLDGKVPVERRAFEGVGTRALGETGEWERHPLAGSFPLLEAVSEIGQVSPYLTKQWQGAKSRLDRLTRLGMVE